MLVSESPIMYRLLWTVYFLLVLPAAAGAHEFWIEPTRFEVSQTEDIIANLRVGQYFKGNNQVYLPDTFVSFTVTDLDGTRPVKGRIGDLPAVRIPAGRNGLHILAYHSTPSSVTYSSYDKFRDFARKHGFEWVIEAHQRRGLPTTDITESYTRYAKSLVKVGDGTGRDESVGMPFELVAETNPYTDLSDDITVRLLRLQKPQAGARISVFRKFVGCDATRTTVITDADGRANIPTGPGGRFLVNAVHIQAPGPRGYTPWESLWASLTFMLPKISSAAESEKCESSRGTTEGTIR